MCDYQVIIDCEDTFTVLPPLDIYILMTTTTTTTNLFIDYQWLKL